MARETRGGSGIARGRCSSGDGQRRNILVRWPDPERWRGKSIKDLPFAKRIMAAKEGTIEEDGPDGVRELYAFTTLKGAQGAGLVRVIIGIPTKLAFAEADRFLKRNLAFLVVTLLAVGAAWVGGDAIVASLKK